LFLIGEKHGHGQQKCRYYAGFTESKKKPNNEQRRKIIARYVQQRNTTPANIAED
jgi:hypothetical protein